MSSIFNKFFKHDDDEEIDVVFDLTEPETPSKNAAPLPLNVKKNKVLAVWGSPSAVKQL